MKREEQKSFFKEKKLDLKALKDQATLDFGRCLKSITINGNTTKINRNNYRDNGKILENAFKNAKIDEETKKLVYKFPGQSAISTSSFLLFHGSEYLDYTLSLSPKPGDSTSDSYNITVNDDGSVEVQTRCISQVVVMLTRNKLPMVIEEVHTFKINKGEDTYKTTNAKITVYKLESTDVQLTEKDLKNQKVLSQVKYDGDKDSKKI